MMDDKKIIKIAVKCICVICAILLINSAKYRLSGTISVSINGEAVKVENVECFYEASSVDKVKSKITYKGDSVKVKEIAFAYGIFTHTFDINVNGNIITPEIEFFKSNNHEKYYYDIHIEIYEEMGIWNADVTYSLQGRADRTQTFTDVLNNPIVISDGP